MLEYVSVIVINPRKLFQDVSRNSQAVGLAENSLTILARRDRLAARKNEAGSLIQVLRHDCFFQENRFVVS